MLAKRCQSKSVLRVYLCRGVEFEVILRGEASGALGHNRPEMRAKVVFPN